MLKIKKFDLKGIRGVKNDCLVELDGKSVLFYGDSGVGKSSISDVFEWFHYDRVDHLSGEEIGRSGLLEALRNISLNVDEKSLVSIDFSNPALNSDRVIYFKRGSLTSEYSNNSPEFINFLEAAQKENFILRYEDLVKFVLHSKTDKLKELSDIIGFSEVTRIRSILKKIVNGLERDVRTKNFDNLVNTQQNHLLENLGENIVSDRQFINSVNELIKPLNIDVELTGLGEIDNVLSLIKTPDDSKKIELQSFYVKIYDFATNLLGYLNEIEKLYKAYYDQYKKITSDLEKINKIVLENLLSEGYRVLINNIFTEEKCPLCLLPKNRAELLKELKVRIKELEKYNSEKVKLEESRAFLKKILTDLDQLLKLLLSDDNFKSEDNKTLKEKAEVLINNFNNYFLELAADISEVKKLKEISDLAIDVNILEQIIEFCKQKNEHLKVSMKHNLKVEAYSKINLSRNSYLEIKRLNQEKKILDNQISSMKLIYGEFVKKQQEGLNSFLSLFSKDINDLYQFMNPDEKVEDIEFLPLEKDDELTGITIQLRFLKNKVKPPQKYLSESHINCLGIAFFLTSAKAFNKQVGFLIIDDVISSFDTNHRTRFAHLLVEKFSDYQIILLTHEKNWFDYVNNLVKGRNWIVGSIKWSEDKGTHIEEPPKNLKERIENKINKSDETGLGNDIRKYLEYLLKHIAFSVGVKVPFRFNDKNEGRMSYELLTCLNGKLSKQPCEDLKNNPVINRLLTSLFIGTKDSHNSPFNPSMGDYKAFWNDVEELENLFFCNSCHKYVSLEYFDRVNNKIRCSCPNKNYDWKF